MRTPKNHQSTKDIKNFLTISNTSTFSKLAKHFETNQYNMSKIACAILICMLVATCLPSYGEAGVTCGQVTSSLAPCMGYLKTGGSPTPPCCNGVKSLNSMASTPADRKAACGCLKTAAGSIAGMNMDAAKTLPSKCGVNIPYPISTSIDCSTVN
ncbi:Non-specific lipid-transfer protein [Bienertia sinuspersici]